MLCVSMGPPEFIFYRSIYSLGSCISKERAGKWLWIHPSIDVARRTQCLAVPPSNLRTSRWKQPSQIPPIPLSSLNFKPPPLLLHVLGSADFQGEAFRVPSAVAMGQGLGLLRDRAQGKLQVRRICDKVFDQFADKKTLLSIDKLHVATLLVYNSVNKQLLSPHKEPPSMQTVRSKGETIRSKGYEGLDKNQFFDLIMEWIHRDLRIVLANRIILALLAAPIMAIKTKSAAMKVPRIRRVAEKVPTPLIISAYSVGLVLLQDSRVD